MSCKCGYCQRDKPRYGLTWPCPECPGTLLIKWEDKSEYGTKPMPLKVICGRCSRIFIDSWPRG